MRIFQIFVLTAVILSSTMAHADSWGIKRYKERRAEQRQRSDAWSKRLRNRSRSYTERYYGRRGYIGRSVTRGRHTRYYSRKRYLGRSTSLFDYQNRR